MSFDCPPSCPFVAPMRGELKFPVGQVHRLGAAAKDPEVDETRRNVLKLAAVAGLLGAGGLGFGAGALQYAQPPVVGAASYFKCQLIDLDGTPLTVDKATAEYNVNTADLLLFNYPLQNEPNFFLNLAAPPNGTGGVQNVPGGIGPNGAIVAYSAICQHLGCPAPAIEYYPPGTCGTQFNGRDFYIHCSCHGSTYDVANGAANLTGPAVLPLPQVILETDAQGNIFATGMTANSPPVNGHLNTLQGDYPVGASVQLAKQQPSQVDCSFPS
ncbi:MAG: Rieske 2Fe-2S domain-containing protein [Thermoplasmata archaeon]|nr:Rieske 2Fe-2S domain-containing protein [Thermoplasmata archaeon]